MRARSTFRMALALTLIVLASGSFLACRRASAAEELVLTESNAGQTFHLENGKSVFLNVTSNGSVGYSWSFEKIAGDALVSVPDESHVIGSLAPGSSEITTYRFRAVKVGQATILMNYTNRTGSTFATQTRTFTIIVDKAS